MKTTLIVLLAHLIWFIPAASPALAQVPQNIPTPAHADSSHKPVAPWGGAQFTRSPSEWFDKGIWDGQQWAATTHSADSWAFGGVACGMVSGLVGTAIITAFASSGNTDMPWDLKRQLDQKDVSYQGGFRTGYAAAAQKSNVSNALWGGLGGTAITVAVIIAVVQSRRH